MVINISVQYVCMYVCMYVCGFLPDIILLAQGYYH